MSLSKKRQAGEEVTPEMIEAGARAGWGNHIPPEIARDLANRIYRAMAEVRIRAASSRHRSEDTTRAM